MKKIKAESRDGIEAALTYPLEFAAEMGQDIRSKNGRAFVAKMVGKYVCSLLELEGETLQDFYEK